MIYNGYEDRLAAEKTEIFAVLPRFINEELREEVVMKDKEKYIGKKFGRWTILEFDEVRNRQDYYICICDCGNKKSVNIYRLLYGTSKSCGCYNREVHRELMIKRNGTDHPSYKHGGWKTRLFKIWDGIKYRCNCSTSKDYCRYGGRGIKICDEWLTDFVAFRDWALKNGYRDDLIIDREDNNGDYTPKNCRWVTYKESSRNTRTSCNYLYKGEHHTAQELADIAGLPLSTIKNRICWGWSLEKIMKTPKIERKKYLFRGKYYYLHELSEMFSVERRTISTRINRLNWTLEEALCTPIGKKRKKE